jgi:hypothetical protein
MCTLIDLVEEAIDQGRRWDYRLARFHAAFFQGKHVFSSA